MNIAANPNISLRSGAMEWGRFPELPSLPRRRYLDKDFYQAELQHLWRKTWLGAGHISEFPNAGSYRLLDIPFAPVIVVMGKDGVLRAFLNSCQHRGATVIKESEKEGCQKVLSCQYHGWTYDLTGKLVGVPEEEYFHDLNMSERSLVSVRCELWGGFVFINFDPEAPALLEWMAPLVRRYSDLFGAPLRVVSKHSWEINCNWKIVLDAFRETYHVPLIHADSAAQLVDANDTFIELHPNGHNNVMIGYQPALLESGWDGVMANTSLQSMPGTEREDYVKNVVTPCIFPNIMCTIQAPGFPLLQWWPLSVDKTRVDFIWYGMDWGNGPKPAEWDAVVAAFDMVIAEDLSNLVSIQKSLEADPDKQIPLSAKEVVLYQMHAEIDRVIGAKNIAPDLYVRDILQESLVP